MEALEVMVLPGRRMGRGLKVVRQGMFSSSLWFSFSLFFFLFMFSFSFLFFFMFFFFVVEGEGRGSFLVRVLYSLMSAFCLLLSIPYQDESAC